MSDTKDQHEPSMEEILASIRRIIAEDNEAPAAAGETKDVAQAAPVPASAAVPAQDDVLELTDVVEEDDPVANILPAVPDAPTTDAPASDQHDVPLLKLDPELPALAAGAPHDRLISSTSAAASIASLSQLVARGQRDRSGELPLGGVNRTLEDVVRELLRPMLREWLDDKLPPLVERLVRDEIARLVREAQGR